MLTRKAGKKDEEPKNRARRKRIDELVLNVKTRTISPGEITELAELKRVDRRRQRAVAIRLAAERQAEYDSMPVPPPKKRYRGPQGPAGGIRSVVSGGLPGLGKRH